MKAYLWAAAISLSVISTAQALEITNLDNVEHRVLFRTSGDQQVVIIAPDETANIIGKPNGTLSLLSAKDPKAAKDVVQTDGLLKQFIGNGRTTDIPAESRDAFVIWEDGTMGIQQRRRGGHRGN